MLWNAISCILVAALQQNIKIRTVIFIDNIHILSYTYFPIFQSVGGGGVNSNNPPPWSAHETCDCA